MISASELVDVHLGGATPEQGERVAALIREISNLSKASKDTLVSELLAIVVNPAESTLRRVQAARTLGHQAKRLEILGATSISDAAVAVLREQFFRPPTTDANAGSGAPGLSKLEGMRVFLFQYLVYLVFVTNHTSGAELLSEITKALGDTELAVTVKALWQRSQEERA